MIDVATPMIASFFNMDGVLSDDWPFTAGGTKRSLGAEANDTGQAGPEPTIGRFVYFDFAGARLSFRHFHGFFFAFGFAVAFAFAFAVASAFAFAVASAFAFAVAFAFGAGMSAAAAAAAGAAAWAAAVMGATASGAVAMVVASAIVANVFNMSGGLCE